MTDCTRTANDMLKKNDKWQTTGEGTFILTVQCAEVRGFNVVELDKKRGAGTGRMEAIRS